MVSVALYFGRVLFRTCGTSSKFDKQLECIGKLKIPNTLFVSLILHFPGYYTIFFQFLSVPVGTFFTALESQAPSAVPPEDEEENDKVPSPPPELKLRPYR